MNAKTTEELKSELETVKASKNLSEQTWNKIFEIEKELAKRNALVPAFYCED